MNTRYTFLIIVVSGITITANGIFNRRIISQIRNEKTKCENQVVLLRDLLDGVDTVAAKEWYTNQLTIDKNIVLVDPQGSYIDLATLITTPKLVYRYTESSCFPCVENDFQILKRLEDKIGSDNILIVADYSRLNQLKILVDQYSLGDNVFNFNGRFFLPIEISDRESLFYFLLSENLLVTQAHYTNPSHNWESPYFENIKRYFEKRLWLK